MEYCVFLWKGWYDRNLDSGVCLWDYSIYLQLYMLFIFYDSMIKMEIFCDNFFIENCIDLFKVLNNEWNIYRYKLNL